VENDAPDESQGQFMIPIYNVSSSDVHKINLEMEKYEFKTAHNSTRSMY